MTMTSYNGPAVLVVGEAEVTVEAHLVSDDDPGRLGHWAGFVTCEPTMLRDLLGERVVLRLPYGTEAAVVITTHGDVEGDGHLSFDT